MHAQGLTGTSWADGPTDGLGAMVDAWSAAAETDARRLDARVQQTEERRLTSWGFQAPPAQVRAFRRGRMCPPQQPSPLSRHEHATTGARRGVLAWTYAESAKTNNTSNYIGFDEKWL
jgi:hypothetical protein